MKVHTILLLNQNTIVTLPDQDLPDGFSNAQLVDYIRTEWTPPPGMLDNFDFAPGVTLRPIFSPAGSDSQAGWLFLTPIRPLGTAHALGVTFRSRKSPLTVNQKTVLAMLKQGASTKQICQKLKRSRRWVMYRIAEIKEFYGVQTRLEVAIQSDDYSRFMDSNQHAMSA